MVTTTSGNKDFLTRLIQKVANNVVLQATLKVVESSSISFEMKAALRAIELSDRVALSSPDKSIGPNLFWKVKKNVGAAFEVNLGVSVPLLVCRSVRRGK